MCFHLYLWLVQGIGMNVLAYDIAHNPAVDAMDIPYLSLEEILPVADVVSLHVPLLPSTYEIMNKPRCADGVAECYLPAPPDLVSLHVPLLLSTYGITKEPRCGKVGLPKPTGGGG